MKGGRADDDDDDDYDAAPPREERTMEEEGDDHDHDDDTREDTGTAWRTDGEGGRGQERTGVLGGRLTEGAGKMFISRPMYQFPEQNKINIVDDITPSRKPKARTTLKEEKKVKTPSPTLLSHPLLERKKPLFW